MGFEDRRREQERYNNDAPFGMGNIKSGSVVVRLNKVMREAEIDAQRYMMYPPFTNLEAFIGRMKEGYYYTRAN